MLASKLKPINLIRSLTRNFNGISKELEVSLRAKYNMKDSSLDRYLEEQVILLNQKDEEIGSLSLLESHLTEKVEQDNLIHRAFSVFIFNQKNELLLQQRSANKMAFPLQWTNSVCSHPLHNLGENIDKQIGTKKAAIRRISDELNLKEDIQGLCLVDKIYYTAVANEFFSESEIDYIYLYRRTFDSDLIDFNKREINDIAWVGRQDFDQFIKDKLNKNESFTPWFEQIRKTGNLNYFWDQLEINEVFDQNEKDIEIMYFS